MAGPVTIDWGDGTAVETGPEQGQVSHAYAAPGDYTITVCDQGDATACTEAEVTLPFEVPVPLELDYQLSDTDSKTVTLTATGADGATADFDFGDGTPVQTEPVTDGTATATHQYA